MTERNAAAAEARALLARAYDGVLSTHSVEVAGYPFGSVVPYCLDRSGRPVILIAGIAQHSKNIGADPRVSLIVLDRNVDDVQANGRLTLLADARPLPEAARDTIERYYRYFPNALDYHQTHGFRFVRLEPVRLRYIGGFGRIHWLEPRQVMLANPFDGAQETAMVEHMNRDHPAALFHYLRRAGPTPTQDLTPYMAGIDGEGFHLRVGARIVRCLFPEPVATPAEARAALVAMARTETPRRTALASRDTAP